MPADGRIDFGRNRCRDLDQRVIDLNGSVYAGDMDEGIAI